MESMFVPEPVVSLSIQPLQMSKEAALAKALGRFQREDPTFKVQQDPESGQTIISGMGELHLDIYTERMKREYDCPVVTGKPYVAYRETITKKATFDYLHKSNLVVLVNMLVSLVTLNQWNWKTKRKSTNL